MVTWRIQEKRVDVSGVIFDWRVRIALTSVFLHVFQADHLQIRDGAPGRREEGMKMGQRGEASGEPKLGRPHFAMAHENAHTLGTA